MLVLFEYSEVNWQTSYEVLACFIHLLAWSQALISCERSQNEKPILNRCLGTVDREMSALRLIVVQISSFYLHIYRDKMQQQQ